MAAIGTTTCNAILNLTFRATAWGNYADNAASSPESNIAVALHTADPGAGGTQATSESAYTNYVRVNVARSTGWTAASTASTNPAANIDFASSGAAGTTITFFSTGKVQATTGTILWWGGVSPSIAIGGSGVTPRLTTATAITLA